MREKLIREILEIPVLNPPIILVSYDTDIFMLKMKHTHTHIPKPVKPMTFSSVQPVSSRTGTWTPQFTEM